MKITKETLKQLIKEELESLSEVPTIPGGLKRSLEDEAEKARQASPERKLAIYKSKVHKMRGDQARQIRRMIRLQKDLQMATDIISQGRTPEMQRILDLARTISNDLDSIHNAMLELKNMD